MSYRHFFLILSSAVRSLVQALSILWSSRRASGVTLGLALARNVGTCRPDGKGDAQMGCPRESKSTDAGHRDGAARSRVESSVMGPDRRGCVVQLSSEANQQWEEPRG